MHYRLSERRPALAKNPLLLEASATELRVLLCLMELGEGNLKTLTEAVGADEGDVQSALQFWRGAGMIKSQASDTPPTKSEKPRASEARLSVLEGKALASAIDGEGLASFLDACQGEMGHTFNERELSVAVSLCTELGLSPEYVLTLIAYCVKLDKKSMAYVERVAFTFLLDRGIDTVEKLEAHIASIEQMHSKEGFIRRLFGFGERAMTKKEEKAIITWFSVYGYDEHMIESAYDKTVAGTGKASVPYCDKILSHWHEMGCRCVADAEALELRESKARASAKSKKAAQTDKPSEHRSFDVEDFFTRALERSYGKADDKKEKE